MILKFQSAVQWWCAAPLIPALGRSRESSKIARASHRNPGGGRGYPEQKRQNSKAARTF